jgi:ribosomal protein S6E (S10)
MKVTFKKNGKYSIILIPEDDIESAILKKIGDSNEGLQLLNEPTRMVEETISIGSLVISEKS